MAPDFPGSSSSPSALAEASRFLWPNSNNHPGAVIRKTEGRSEIRVSVKGPVASLTFRIYFFLVFHTLNIYSVFKSEINMSNYHKMASNSIRIK